MGTLRRAKLSTLTLNWTKSNDDFSSLATSPTDALATSVTDSTTALATSASSASLVILADAALREPWTWRLSSNRQLFGGRQKADFYCLMRSPNGLRVEFLTFFLPWVEEP